MPWKDPPASPASGYRASHQPAVVGLGLIASSRHAKARGPESESEAAGLKWTWLLLVRSPRWTLASAYDTNPTTPKTVHEFRCIFKSRERAVAPLIPDRLAVGGFVRRRAAGRRPAGNGSPGAPGFAGPITAEAPAGLPSRVQHRIRGPSVLERQRPERTPTNRTDGEVWPGVGRVWPTGGTDPPAGDRRRSPPRGPQSPTGPTHTPADNAGLLATSEASQHPCQNMTTLSVQFAVTISP
jgi:hypothetical protein